MTELEVETEGATLAVSYQPAGETALVALHGASEGTRDASPLYEHLHRVIPPLSIGVATFDRRGEGASSGAPSVGRFELQVSDGLAVAEALDVERLVLWGYSQGGWIAPLAASRATRVVGLVTIASTGVTPERQMRFGVARNLRNAGYDDEVVETVDALRADVASAMRGTYDDELALRRRLRDASAEPWWSLAYLGDELPDEEGRRAWCEEMDYDPRPSFAAVSCPTLCVYGADDEWQPVDESAAAWRAAKPDVEVLVLDGVGHSLVGPSGEIDPRYERRLVTWLASGTVS